MDNHPPLITAIIPTYKRPKLLKRAVRSFLAQTYPHFNIVIADNNSGKETDEAVEMLMQQDPRIKLLQHKTNIGLTATLQSALMQTTTPYVCFLCDDDFVAPYFFEETLPAMVADHELAFCGGGALLIDQHYQVRTLRANNQQILPSGYYPPPKGYFAYLYSTFAIGLCSLLIDTKKLKEVGGFDLRIRNGTDEDPISKCAVRYPIYLKTERPYFFAFQHDQNMSSRVDYILNERECQALYENLSSIPFTLQEKSEIAFFFHKRMIKILSKAHHHFSLHKDFKTARDYASKLKKLEPSFKWKRKGFESLCFDYLPFLSHLLPILKSWEKKGRQIIKREKKIIPQTCSAIPDDAAYWKQYALKLEAGG